MSVDVGWLAAVCCGAQVLVAGSMLVILVELSESGSRGRYTCFFCWLLCLERAL